MDREGRRLVALGALLIAAIIVIIVSRQSTALQPLTSVLMTPLRPIASFLSDVTNGAIDLTGEREDYLALETKVQELEHIVAELQVDIVRYREIELDYYRLSELLDYAADHPDQNLVTADVIARDTSSYLRMIIVNRGTRDGIRVGNPVISELGLVGRVEKVVSDSAWIRLAIDPDSAVNARLQTAGAEGTIIGQLQGGLRMEFIPREATVEAGDLALTSGLGGTYPANLVIGRVTSVARGQADPFQSAEVRPVVDFDSLRIVSVVVDFDPVDTSVFSEPGGGDTGQ